MAQKQYLRDAEHLDFLVGEIDMHIGNIIAAAKEDGTQEQDRPRVRRLRLLQRNLRFNAEQVRTRGDEHVPDEF